MSETVEKYNIAEEGTMYEIDNRVRFQNGRLFILETPIKNGKQSDFPKMIDITEKLLDTFLDIIKMKI